MANPHEIAPELQAGVAVIALAQNPDTTSFGERFFLAISGPLLSAIVGTGLIGVVLWKIADATQAKRERANRDLEQRHFDNELRHELLTSAVTAASALYLATQMFWRTKSDRTCSDEEKANAREVLDNRYHACRVDSSVIEVRLKALFEDDQPRTSWHRVSDLLTVRYMQLIGRATPGLYARNAVDYNDEEHSGLNVKQLRNAQLLLDTYHETVADVAEKILTRPLRSSVDATRDRV